MKNTVFVLVMAILGLLACKKETQPVLPGFPWDCDFDIGNYELLPSSLTDFPYEGKQLVVFKDSLGNEAIFNIARTAYWHKKSGFTYASPLNINDEKVYCYYADSILYTAHNDSASLELNISLYTSPFRNLPLDSLIADLVNISTAYKGIYGLHIIYGVYNTGFAQRTFPSSFGNIPIDSISFFGNTFYQVEYYPSFFQFHHPIYFTHTQGVVLFHEPGGKSWRFDRFE
jgi:hypothetical protein